MRVVSVTTGVVSTPVVFTEELSTTVGALFICCSGRIKGVLLPVPAPEKRSVTAITIGMTTAATTTKPTPIVMTMCAVTWSRIRLMNSMAYYIMGRCLKRIIPDHSYPFRPPMVCCHIGLQSWSPEKGRFPTSLSPSLNRDDPKAPYTALWPSWRRKDGTLRHIQRQVSGLPLGF